MHARPVVQRFLHLQYHDWGALEQDTEPPTAPRVPQHKWLSTAPGVCSRFVGVCTLDGLIAEHEFWVWVTILGRMSLQFFTSLSWRSHFYRPFTQIHIFVVYMKVISVLLSKIDILKLILKFLHFQDPKTLFLPNKKIHRRAKRKQSKRRQTRQSMLLLGWNKVLAL